MHTLKTKIVMKTINASNHENERLLIVDFRVKGCTVSSINCVEIFIIVKRMVALNYTSVCTECSL